MDQVFDSEFCNVSYVEKDHVVLLTWKKFCCFDDYRKPTLFASQLLKEHDGSHFVGAIYLFVVRDREINR